MKKTLFCENVCQYKYLDLDPDGEVENEQKKLSFIRFVANPDLITNHSLSPPSYETDDNISSSFVQMTGLGFVDFGWLIWFGRLGSVSLAWSVQSVWF